MNMLFLKPADQAVKYKLNRLSFCIKTALVASIFMPAQVFAEEIFNPAFLSDGLSNSSISDLSKFENTTHQLPGIYRVDLIANDEYITTKDINFIEKVNGQDSTGLFPCLNLAMLESFGINIRQYDDLIHSKDQQCIDFTSIIQDSSSQFIFDKQKLKLSFPQISLKNQIRGYIPPDQWDNGITGLFTNYYLSGSHNSKTDNESIFLGLNSGFNLGSWQFRNSSSFNYNSNNQSSHQEWTNLSTNVQKNIVPLKSQLLLGDGSTTNEIFDSFSYRGVHLFSSDAMYPDSQQGYAPTVRGIARTNAKVIIKQNGYLLQQTNVPPGPFVIDDLNPTSVSGDLNITIEENDGTVQQYTIPYSTLPILQRESRTKYSVIAGQYRSGLNHQEKPHVVQATAIHGFKKGISVYAGTQLSDKYQSSLLGIGSNLGEFGAISFDITHANSQLADESHHQGQSMRFLYAKSLMSSGTTFRLLGYRYSTKGFYTLNDVAYSKMSNDETLDNNDENVNQDQTITNYYNLNNAKKGRFEINISHSLGKYGSLFISGNQQTYWGTEKSNQWLQAGYAGSWRGMNFSLSLSHTKYSQIKQSDTVFTANVSFPLSTLFPKSNLKKNPLRNSYITTSTSQSSNNNNSYLTNMSGTLLKNRNLSYSLSQGHIENSGSTGSLSLGYQGGYGNVSVGYSHDQNNTQFTYNAAGGILLHSNGVTFGQSLSDTSVLVKVPGAKNVTIENYIGVKTDWRGYAIVPYASAYRQNRIALNSDSFSNNLEINNNVQTVIPIQGAIARASFEPSIGVRALATITHQGQFIPYASTVIETKTLAQGFAADEGRVYLTGLPPKGTLNINWGSQNSQHCSVPYDISSMDLSKPITQFNLECD